MRSLACRVCVWVVALFLMSAAGSCSDPFDAAGSGGVGGGGGMAGTGGAAGDGGSGGAGGTGGVPVDLCPEARAAALRACVWDVNQARRACYVETDEPCPSNDPAINR